MTVHRGFPEPPDPPSLPRRDPGTALPVTALPVTALPVTALPTPRRGSRGPRSSAVVPENRWAAGDTALRLLLNGLRRWDTGR